MNRASDEASFDELLPAQYAGALKRLKFDVPTRVQQEALPKAWRGESFFAIAPTGTGKTLVYLLPLWRQAAEGTGRALVVLPTRELAYQVSQMLSQLHPSLRDEIALAIGGHPLEKQQERLGHKWSVLLATPGRLIELLEAGSVRSDRIKLLVLDEFDKLISMGFSDQIEVLLKLLPGKRQRLCFSATAAEPGLAERLGLEDIPALEIAAGTEAKTMEERVYFLKSARTKQKLLLEALAENQGQALVFVRNREKANHLHGLLKLRGIKTSVLHGHLDQKERARVFQNFRDGKLPVLIATDLAGRGLDITEVSLIVNYDVPQNYKDYLHRIGRTARAGRTGVALTFGAPDEYIPMRNLCDGYPGELPTHPAFANREAWFIAAKRKHDAEVKAEQRSEAIRREQGLAVDDTEDKSGDGGESNVEEESAGG